MAELCCSHLELNRAALSRQYLIDRLPAGTGAAAAVSAIGALQSQYNPSPFLALHARVEGFTADELRAALDSHQVVKASLMRGTLHAVSAADYPMYASVVDGPVTRLWITWLGKFLDVVPMQAALLDLTDPGPCTRQQVVEFCAAWATDHFPPEAVWPPVGSWFFARCYPWLLRTPDTTRLDSHKSDGYIAARAVRPEWAPPPIEGALADALRGYLLQFGPAGVDDIGKFLGENRVRAVRAALAAPANRGRVLPPAYYDDVIKTVNGQIMATVLVDRHGRRYVDRGEREGQDRDHGGPLGALGPQCPIRGPSRSRTGGTVHVQS